MADRDTFSELAEEIGLALAPLAAALQSPDSFAALMAELGWDMRVVPAVVADIGSALTNLLVVVGNGEIDASTVEAAMRGIRGVVAAVRAVGDSPPGSLPPTVDADEFLAEFPTQLIDFLLVDHLLGNRAPWGQILNTLGVVRIEDVPATATRLPYTRRAIDWSDLGRVFDDPAAIFRNGWGWGAADFRQEGFLESVHELAVALGLPAYTEPLAPGVRDLLSGGTPGPDDVHDWAVRIPVLGDLRSGPAAEAGLGVFMVPATGGASPGLALLPYLTGTNEITIDLSDTLQLTIEAGIDLEGGVAMVLTPGSAPRLLVGLVAAATTQTAPGTGTHLTVALSSRAESPTVLLGSADGSHLQVGPVSLRLGARLTSDQRIDVFGELAFEGGEIAIRPGADADGFLAKLLPGDGIKAAVALGIGLSSSQGLYLTGSGGLEVDVPLHAEIGPLEISSARITVRPDSSGIPVGLGLSFSAALGPLQVSVENCGLTVTLRFPPGGGNAGPLDVALGFLPPTGAGLAVDAGVVTGGGFLDFDPAAGEYAGALELEFADFLSLKAIGLVTTRMPDGSAGFSLLLVITAEFPGGLELGYGFKLLGVGGLIGLNRGMRLDAIMEGVRSGAIESVMFPHDVVANAPRILSDLKAFFPPQEGVFLIGPMVKIGWGTPTLISVSLGIIIEIPGNIALLGVLKVALPTEDEAILKLQVNFAGAIEFDKKRLYFFAALFDSRILAVTIEGELGLLVAYGDQPDFVLTVGGFHPAFKPPALPFAVPRRISINLLNSDVGRIGVEGYFAITSNTAQFGAHAELFLGLGAFSVHGHLDFDALFQFSPFSFEIEISAGMSVKVFGVGLFSVSLDFTLSGPTPWEARGSASISLLFFSIGVDFDITWGEKRDVPLPPVTVLPLLKGELDKPESWRVNNPSGGAPLVTLRSLPSAEADVVLHPLGTVVVQQRAVPLDIRVDKVGNEAAVDVSSAHVEVDSGGLVKRADAGDMFALAQFQNLSDADKLSLPAFERQNAGVELKPDGNATTSVRAVRRSARYEQVVIDEAVRTPTHLVSYNTALFQHLMAGAGVARSPLSRGEKHLRQPFSDRIAVTGDAYVVASTRDNTARTDVFASYAQASKRLDTMLATDPGLIDTLHVIPATEVVA
jgi:hypothetical protein